MRRDSDEGNAVVVGREHLTSCAEPRHFQRLHLCPYDEKVRRLLPWARPSKKPKTLIGNSDKGAELLSSSNYFNADWPSRSLFIT